jgi:hypothetical protein
LPDLPGKKKEKSEREKERERHPGRRTRDVAGLARKKEENKVKKRKRETPRQAHARRCRA